MFRSRRPAITSRSATSALASMSLMNEASSDHVPHRLGGTVDRGPESALEEVGVGEEHPVLDAVDDHARGDTGIRVIADVDVPVVRRADHPSTASAGRAALRMTSMIDRTTATTIACRTPMVTTNTAVIAAMTTSDRAAARE